MAPHTIYNSRHILQPTHHSHTHCKLLSHSQATLHTGHTYHKYTTSAPHTPHTKSTLTQCHNLLSQSILHHCHTLPTQPYMLHPTYSTQVTQHTCIPHMPMHAIFHMYLWSLYLFTFKYTLTWVYTPDTCVRVHIQPRLCTYLHYMQKCMMHRYTSTQR